MPLSKRVTHWRMVDNRFRSSNMPSSSTLCRPSHEDVMNVDQNIDILS